jgi:ferredoxin
LGGLSALQDQAAAGVLMWVPGSAAFLLPLFALALRALYGTRQAPTRRPDSMPARVGSRIALPVVGFVGPTGAASPRRRVAASGFDLLRVPLLGRFLRWRHARAALQVPLLLLAAAVIYDGFRGPAVGPMNLAGVLPWIHWRGLVVFGLLVAGNVFCLGCPFLLPRTVARRWLPARWKWPRQLRSKWVAVGLLGGFFWAYEAFALWDSPWLTAWVAVGYFVLALAVDGLFRGASFCKYVCPVGQFNFVQSLVSPLEVKVIDPAVCATCRTRDCIRGRDGIPGCELGLYQPRKAGNMDCTFCLDCAHACPHDNVGVLAGPPGRDLWHDPVRSGVGRFGARPDLAALVLLLTAGAFANAAGMVGPVVAAQERLTTALGLRSPLPVVTLFYALALGVLPLAAVYATAALCRRWAGLPGTRTAVATRYVYALVPLGFGMWLAHYGFHILTSYDAAVPAAQRFAGDLGWAGLGRPEWVASCCRPVAAWLPRLEILFLDAGLLLSLYTAYRIALTQAPNPAKAFTACLPWAFFLAVLFGAGVWIVLQPMQMRGTFG